MFTTLEWETWHENVPRVGFLPAGRRRIVPAGFPTLYYAIFTTY